MDMYSQTQNQSLRNEAEAQALRVFAASGFGDAAIGVTEPHKVADSFALYQLARAHRSYQLREILGAMRASVADFVRRLVDKWKRQEHAAATYRALHGLDSRTLRDLGFHRSEIQSFAAEVAGRADLTRLRSLQTLRSDLQSSTQRRPLWIQQYRTAPAN
jgi:uncharacterized protein YjiS (DUF1127 family)